MLKTKQINQTQAPSGASYGGVYWTSLGRIQATSGTGYNVLGVRVSGPAFVDGTPADGDVVADGVMVVLSP